MAKLDWIDDRIRDLEESLLQEIFACETQEAVEATINYARFLANSGLTPQNQRVFLRLLEIENKWVAEALIGDADPEAILSSLQPSTELVRSVFAILGGWKPEGANGRNILALLGVLRRVYSSPRDGYRTYPLSMAELSALGKHLDKAKGQDHPANRAILQCLDKLSGLEDPNNEALDRIAVQATAVRNAFFDDRRKISDVIPEAMLGAGETPKPVRPRKEAPFDAKKGRVVESSDKK